MTRRGRTYTPARTHRAERSIVAQAINQIPGKALGCVHIEAEFVMPIPRSWPKWKKVLARAGGIPHTTRPDVDNLLKLVMDALNGIAYVDDTSVNRVTGFKRYAKDGECLKTMVTLTSWPPAPSRVSDLRS